MRKPISGVALAAIFCVFPACSTPDEGGGSDQPTSKPASRPAEKTGRADVKSPAKNVAEASAEYEVFGAPIAAGSAAMSVDDVVKNLDDYDGKTVRVETTVASVCKKKGCWIWTKGDKEKMYVRFKDYAFFVPLDCEGRSVLLEGVVQKKEMTVAEARHIAEDAGDHEAAKKIDKPVDVAYFMASGVRMKRSR